jgi:tyrosine-protein phosphatase SIW14
MIFNNKKLFLVLVFLKNFIATPFAFTCGIIRVFLFLTKRKVASQKLLNFFVVDDYRLMRGGCPSSKGFLELQKRGIKTIINLRYKFSKKTKIFENYGIKVISLPFAPYNPNDDLLIKFLNILKDESAHPVYVHCFHGRDRTGLACAIYRIIVQNWTKEKAISEMKLCGLNWWHKNMIDYIKKLDILAFKEKMSNQTI